MTRPSDPRAPLLCAACNQKRDDRARTHCQSPTCTWWICGAPGCGAVNYPARSNDKTNRDGSVRK